MSTWDCTRALSSQSVLCFVFGQKGTVAHPEAKYGVEMSRTLRWANWRKPKGADVSQCPRRHLAARTARLRSQRFAAREKAALDKRMMLGAFGGFEY